MMIYSKNRRDFVLCISLKTDAFAVVLSEEDFRDHLSFHEDALEVTHCS